MAKVTVQGVAALVKRLRRAGLNAKVGAEVVTLANARELLRRSRALAPELEGDLIRSGKVTRVPDSRGKTAAVVSFGAPHALVRHEDFYKLGPISASKPATEDGTPGRKYLSRPFFNMRKGMLAGYGAVALRAFGVPVSGGPFGLARGARGPQPRGAGGRFIRG